MKKIISSFIAVIALLVVTSCSTKFNVGAPYKNITVIYGFLDESDTAHYIRVLKAFLDQSKSAITMAQVADSSYYYSINVKIERINMLDTTNRDTIHLNRVDLNKEGYQKEAGVFYTAPNYAYKFTNALDPNYFYRIVVTNLVTGQVDSANSPIIDDIDYSAFYVDALDTTVPKQNFIDFSQTTNSSEYDLTGGYNTPSSYYFYGQATPVAVAQAIIRFNWYDSSIIDHTLSGHSSDYNVGYLPIASSGGIDFPISDLSLYGALMSGMGIAPANTIRLLDRCQFFVYLSTPDYNTYYQSSLTQGTGLTGSDIEPISTNILGPGAIGLFTSRGLRTGRVTISTATVDSLLISPLVAAANIKGTIYH